MWLVALSFSAAAAATGDAPREPSKNKTIRETCESAFENACYDSEPFAKCCDTCVIAVDTRICEWQFKECDNCILNGKFLVPGEEENKMLFSTCSGACEAFNEPTNHHFDYCKGGKVYEAAQKCPNAAASLANSVHQDWCHLAESKVTCNWEYKAFGEPKIRGSFAYAPDNIDCTSACSMLGSNSNSKEMYCDADFVTQLASACPSAKVSLQSNTLSWCSKSSATLGAAGHLGASSVLLAQGPHRSAAVAGPSSLYTQCETAFREPMHCFNYPPFYPCCKKCGESKSYITCSYKTDLPGGDHLEGNFTIPAPDADVAGSMDCVKACGMISKIEVAGDICPGGDVYKQLQTCTNAARVAMKAKLCAKGTTSGKPICKQTGADALLCRGSFASVETETEVVGADSSNQTDSVWPIVAVAAVSGSISAAFLALRHRQRRSIREPSILG